MAKPPRSVSLPEGENENIERVRVRVGMEPGNIPRVQSYVCAPAAQLASKQKLRLKIQNILISSKNLPTVPQAHTVGILARRPLRTNIQTCRIVSHLIVNYS